ncbi:MAG: hypothetical protein FIA96_14900 [Betaproteobacteria bacterium]|nr:hypothetical protein [Betaproteobacteria bacterium]
MKPNLLIGIVLIVLGGAVLGYQEYSYTTKEQVLQIGPITATAEQTHTVSLPPLLGWLLIGGGVFLLAYSAMTKKN